LHVGSQTRRSVAFPEKLEPRSLRWSMSTAASRGQSNVEGLLASADNPSIV
jgi:hypothetical protein